MLDLLSTLVKRIRAFRDTPGMTCLLPRFVYNRDFASGAFKRSPNSQKLVHPVCSIAWLRY